MPIDYSKWDKITDSDNDSDDGKVIVPGARVEACSSDHDAVTSSCDAAPVTSGSDLSKRPSEFRYVCNYCGTYAARTKKCRGCMNAHYCSPECQAQHWEVHKSSCKLKAKARKAREGLLGKESPQTNALKAMLEQLLTSSNVPFFHFSGSIVSDEKHVSTLECGANPFSGSSCISLEGMVTTFRKHFGPGVLIVIFSNAQECEDFALSLSLAAQTATAKDGIWTIGRSIDVPRIQYHTWPSDDALACSTCQSIGNIVAADRLITSMVDDIFAICGYVCPLEGQPRSAAIRVVGGEMASSTELELRAPPVKGLRSSFRSKDAVEFAYDVAREIETATKFQQCRVALSHFQRRCGRKGIVWIRHTKKPSLHGFLVEELRSLTPRSLTKVANAELKKLASLSKGAPLGSFRIVFLELGTHLHMLKDFYSQVTDSFLSEFSKDADLKISHCFFNTWCAADIDSYVTTPLHFPMLPSV